MKFSRGTNYALHTILHLALKVDNNKPIGVQQLAEQQSVSSTYLSKILAKLVKEGLVVSISGANGGYSLGHNWESISFLNIIHAIEGKASLFECHFNHGSGCLIEQVMSSAEKKMEEELLNTTISDVIKGKDTALY
ncbi:Rrf2 family transcriptional regulator [Rossellomorea marisflavi]|uniref:Rrf2 family transcriptional regulator n=1 Tax=Rossellomorea marisflavi TaxID=189381 RepID=UPI00203AE95E|nr:Rrf2 family transcriptional regulator [Rossellomorea marisflavi]MCM2603345.1 Rrf2 family transcriptional regulator [Rossellomorea marisflavi]USK93004.1 Rrf2 family transcriptional regulator [Rossellomorea marisflavi]